jgi:hypothetical protein
MSEENKEQVVSMAEAASAMQKKTLSADDLADRTRYRFREEVLEVPELGGSIVIRSLTVRQREALPSPLELMEIDDEGKRTEAAMDAAGTTFAQIIAEPKLTEEQARSFIGDWPAEAYDRVTEAYRKLVGDDEEEVVQAAAAEFPEAG